MLSYYEEIIAQIAGLINTRFGFCKKYRSGDVALTNINFAISHNFAITKTEDIVIT